MKKVLAVVVLALCSSQVFAYISGIAIQTESHMQVYVNGKLYNKQPDSFVRIKSQPGLFKLEIKVLNPYNKVWYVVRKDIRVEKGYEFYYKVIFDKKRKPELREMKKYPVYSPYYLNPSRYNNHPVT